jgi:5'-nucleotidase
VQLPVAPLQRCAEQSPLIPFPRTASPSHLSLTLLTPLPPHNHPSSLSLPVYDKATGTPYANSPAVHIKEWKGRKIGFVGLVEDDWLATLGAVDPATIEYRDFIAEGDKLAKELRRQGCEYIIALTHSRLPNDEKLANECPELDMVMGGHDHDYVVKEQPNHTWIVKSGTDFRQLTELRVKFPEPLAREAATDADGIYRPFPKGSVTVAWTRHDITADLEEDPATKAAVDEYLAAREKSMQIALGVTEVALDARFATVRTRESNAGNLVADCLTKVLHGDCCLINGGLLRADRVQGPGDYIVKDLVDLLPMATQAVLLEVPGRLFGSILENSVAKYPVLEGRFGQVSGIKFSFDPEQPAGKRVVPGSVSVAGAPLDPERKYKFVTTAYLALGKDGYDAFADPSVKTLVDEENGATVPTVLRNHFRMINVVGKLAGIKKPTGEDHAKKMASRLLSRKKAATESEDPSEDGDQSSLSAPTIAPKVEGRIINIREKKAEDPASAAATPKAADAKSVAPAAAAVAKAAIASAPDVDPAEVSLVFVLGAPGSGKGTQCERIARDFHYKHLSTGDLLRDEVKSGSALGKELEGIMQSGGLVSTDLVLKLLKNAMTENGAKPIKGKYLIDGFPRAPDQVVAFESAICKPTFVLAFDAREEVLEERLVARGKASGRADDNVESIRKRFATFKSQSEPVIQHYASLGHVRALNSERPVDDVYTDVKKLFAAEVQRVDKNIETESGGLAIRAGGAKGKLPEVAGKKSKTAGAASETAEGGAPAKAAQGGCCTVM